MLVIGAGKSGTTSLQHYLGRHPEIFMSDPKEPDYFPRRRWREQLDWYESLFPEPAPVRGEASTSYSAYPVFQDVPRRISELIPDVRLIYLVRDPIDRILAHYSQHRAIGKDDRPLDEAIRSSLRDGDEKPNPYLCVSSYATQVEQYLAVFPAERLLVIDNADLLEDRRTVLRETFRFLGVDESFSSPAFDEILNPKTDQVRFNRAGARLRETRAAELARRRVPPKVRRALTTPLRRALSEPAERPELSPDLRDELSERLGPEADRLRELTGKRFATWSV